MKLALISAVLFLLSYVAVNGGLGPHPWLLVIPLAAAAGSVFAANWMMTRLWGSKAPRRPDFDPDFMDAPPQRHVAPTAGQGRGAAPPRGPTAGPSGSSSGSRARKLF